MESKSWFATQAGKAQGGIITLPIEPEPGAAPPRAPALPALALNAQRTPTEIVAWWDELDALAAAAKRAAATACAPLLAELAALLAQTSATARRRAARWQAVCAQQRASAEAIAGTALAACEGSLAEFSPRLIAMLQAEGLEIADDDELVVAEFWVSLQPPLLECYAGTASPAPASELVRGLTGQP